MWIATVDGLRSFNIKTHEFRYFNHDESDRNSLSDNFTYDVIEDSRGLIWCATNNGLNMYDKKTGLFTVFKQEDCLASSLIVTIIEDNNHTLWMDTSEGITNLIIARDGTTGENIYTFKNYDESDGLQVVDFQENAALKASTGELYFGGPNGFNILHPDNLALPDIPSHIFFTDFRVFNKSIGCNTLLNGRRLLDRSIAYDPVIKVRYNENVITIEFADLNFLRPNHIRYKYTLDGFNTEWFETTSQERKLTCTNPDPGEYTFRVRSTAVTGNGKTRKPG